MSTDTYLLYLLALTAFFATPPGTSQLLMISNSVRHGLGRSMATVFGDLSANCLQMTAAAFGLAAVVTTSAELLTIIKWLGVAYLAWIGIRLFFSKQSASASTMPKSGHLFRQAFLTSMANPYAVVFFGALFPQFIDPALPVWPQLLVLGATYLAVDGALLLLWGLAAEKTLGRLKSMNLGLINRISGVLMIAAAALLASKDMVSEEAR